MLEVEGKTFHKFVEKKQYRTDLYSNFCSIDKKQKFTDYYLNKNKERFYKENTLFSEDDFVKHFGNPFADVSYHRDRFFIEESDDKISIKYQIHLKNRRVNQKFFAERKITHYFSFNFNTKMFYSGTFSTKKKKVIGKQMRVNPTFYAVENFLNKVSIDHSINPESNFYFFLEKIWDRMGIENPQNFQWECIRSFYSLTYYLVNGIKIPNGWKKLTSVFFLKKDLKKFNMNLVDTTMNRLKLKGSKVKQIINEMEWVDFDRLHMVYNILGIDRFNKIENKYFNDDYTSDQQYLSSDYGHNRMGRHFDCFYGEDFNYLPNRPLPQLSSKEKDRVLNIINYFDRYRWGTLIEHLELKQDLLNLGEDVKFKFENISSFNLEHEEFSRLLQSYRKGEVERFYGDVDILETPIEHEGETYYPVLLRKTTDYEKESQHQRNCVRGYSERPDCLIFSIRKGSKDGDERITVEYQYKKNEILNVQERTKFNETPSLEFSQVAKIQLANINLMYKIGTLKLPKLIKKYRNGKVIEQQATFRSLENEGIKVIAMTPQWDTYTPELSYWQNEILDFPQLEPPMDYENENYFNILDELP
jgi:hypothetical protein